MTTPSQPLASLLELLAELETAVHAGDRERAIGLEQAILQGLAKEAAERAELERRVRALMAELNEGKADLSIESFDFLALERSYHFSASGTTEKLKTEAPGVVLPNPSRLFTDDGMAEAIQVVHPNLERSAPSVNVIAIKGQSAFTPNSTPPTKPPGTTYPVWFGTNRKLTADGSGYTGERNGIVSRGRVDVFVPECHRFGEIGSSFWERLKRFDLRDDRLRVQHIEQHARGAFLTEIHQAIQTVSEDGEQSHALFFLHGFNVTFEEAAIRAAQIGVDLKVPGATAFFSWPSRGSVSAYPADEASIEASEQAITDFLVDFALNCGADKIHVIAHSMGNRGLLRALQRISANAEAHGKVKFDQVFLAAPDIDRDLFLDLARLYPEHAQRTTLYASARDLPVHLSSKLHDAPRAGYFEPYTVAPGIDTVAVPDFDIDLLGHSYFAQAEALLHDIYDLMRHGEAPAKRQRVAPAAHEGESFWTFKK